MYKWYKQIINLWSITTNGRIGICPKMRKKTEPTITDKVGRLKNFVESRLK